MVLQAEDTEGIRVVTLPGEYLDASNAVEFKEAVGNLAHPEGRFVFDLSGLRFIDSSGLGALLSASRRIGEHGGELRLCAMTRQVRSLFELVRMHRVFSIHTTREEAVASFNQS